MKKKHHRRGKRKRVRLIGFAQIPTAIDKPQHKAYTYVSGIWVHCEYHHEKF